IKLQSQSVGRDKIISLASKDNPSATSNLSVQLNNLTHTSDSYPYIISQAEELSLPAVESDFLSINRACVLNEDNYSLFSYTIQDSTGVKPAPDSQLWTTAVNNKQLLRLNKAQSIPLATTDQISTIQPRSMRRITGCNKSPDSKVTS